MHETLKSITHFTKDLENEARVYTLIKLCTCPLKIYLDLS